MVTVDRYHDQWKFVTQRLVFVVSFTEFLLSSRLLAWEQVAARLSLTTDRSSGSFYLDLEDYLHGLVSLSNELVSASDHDHSVPQP